MTSTQKKVFQAGLENFLQNSSALGALLIKQNQYAIPAGNLNNRAFRDLKGAIWRNWDTLFKSQHYRVMRLMHHHSFWLVVTKVVSPKDLLLCLVFPADLNLRTIEIELDACIQILHEQLTAVAKGLNDVEQTLHSIPQRNPDQIPAKKDRSSEFVWHHGINSQSQTAENHSFNNTMPTKSNPTNQNRPTKRMLSFGAPSQPGEDPQSTHVILDQKDGDHSCQRVEWSMSDELISHDPKDTAIHQDALDLISLLNDDFDLGGGSVETIRHNDVLVKPILVPKILDQKPIQDETASIHQLRQKETEPLNIGRFSFYFVPRVSNQLITGELPECLRRWIEELCDIYAWQLDSLSVRPEYLNWTLDDFPESLILDMLHIVRDYTSERIFHLFPEYQAEPGAFDFWAHGYLVDSHNQKLSVLDVLKEIKLT